MTSKEIDLKLAEAVAGQALADNVKNEQNKKFLKLIIICVTAFACTLAICSAVAVISIASMAIKADLQKNQDLIDYVSGAEIVTEYIESGDGNAIKIDGDNNTTTGGDMNG